MEDRYKYILSVIENEYDADAVLRQTDTVRIASYVHKASEKRILLIVAEGQDSDTVKSLIGTKCRNVPEIYDVCTNGDETLIIEEFITGTRLSDILGEKKLKAAEAVKYCINICDALAFLHSNNIVHRDIKPSNIIINADNEAMLIDLQTARKISEEHDNDTKNLGTVGYAAPEQFGIVQSMPSTDIYALGVMLNEMLTGKHPSIQTPEGKLGRIIEKCTHTPMLKRYQDVYELKKDLKQCRRIK